MINGSLALGTVAHELGHNLSLLHSHSLVCSDGTSVGPNCRVLEYGDGIDVMGWSDAAHFNAFQKERLGWLNHGVSPPITTVQSSGTYLLAPYEIPGPNPKALKVLKNTNLTTGYSEWYYVELRQPLGFDIPDVGCRGLLQRLGGGNKFDVYSAMAYVTYVIRLRRRRHSQCLGIDRPAKLQRRSDSLHHRQSERWGVTDPECGCGVHDDESERQWVNQTATTDSTGTAVGKLRLKKQDPIGGYRARADATKTPLWGSADTSFTVVK